MIFQYYRNYFVPIFIKVAVMICLGIMVIGCGCSSGGTETVNSKDAVLSSLTITPLDPSVAKGLSIKLFVTGHYSDGTSCDLSSEAIWTSSDTNIATISTGGLVSAKTAGSTMIKATVHSISADALLTVTDAILSDIHVMPVNPSVTAGAMQQFSATGYYSDGTSKEIGSFVTWTSSDTNVATINNAGLASAKKSGSTTIKATLGNASDSTALRVESTALTSISIAPSAPYAAKGQTVQFQATGHYSDGALADLTSLVAWSSSNQDIATINTGGQATSKNVGSTTIKAAFNNISGNTSLTITSVALLSILVTPANSSIAKGTVIQLSATGYYSDGSWRDISSLVTWTSSNQDIATINAGGQASSKNVGSTTIKAIFNNAFSNAVLRVEPAVLKSITISPANSYGAKGSTIQFAAAGTYSDGSLQDISSIVTWNSSNSTIATINGTGLATIDKIGSTAISAKSSSNDITGTTFLYTFLDVKSIKPTGLKWPVNCMPGITCSSAIGYPDIDGDGKAFHCGAPGYTGHTGTDISITTAQMASGMDVYAAADGMVLWVWDGKYDNCPAANQPDCQNPMSPLGPNVSSGTTVCSPAGNFCGTGSCCCYYCFAGGNVIVIRHYTTPGVFATNYQHLKKNSIRVSPGQSVSKGQVIAQVASAGNSSGPHLHFEVWGDGFNYTTDPWAGQCGPNYANSLWDFNY